MLRGLKEITGIRNRNLTLLTNLSYTIINVCSARFWSLLNVGTGTNRSPFDNVNLSYVKQLYLEESEISFS